MKILRLLMVVVVASMGASVYADQSYYITNKTAKRAEVLLRYSDQVRFYCKSCGEKKSLLRDIAVLSVSLDQNKKYWQVNINDKEINLVNTYIPYEGKWYNVAMLLELPATGVGEVLENL